MKKLISVVLALIMILSFAACGIITNKPGGDDTKPGNQGNNTADDAKLTGKLIAIPNSRDDMPVLRGISFSGNRAGSKDFNSKSASTEGIRCIFELNEYFCCTPDTDTTHGIKVYILKHREDQKSYETAQYSDLMAGFVNLYNLDFNTDSNAWDAEMYLNPEDVEPGLYDFVFTYEKTPFAKLITRFYAVGELDGKSDADLEKLMGISGGDNQTAAKTLDGWDGNFAGTVLPAPETSGNITEWTVKTDCVTIRIDGMNYDEYIAYCKKLEAMNGWEVYEGDYPEDVAHFPANYNDRSKVYFTGIYGNLPHISVQYYSDKTCSGNGYPHFCMFVYYEWN